MPGNGGIAVTITAQDRATKIIDSLNQRLARASAPVQRLQKSFDKLADSTGIRAVNRQLKTAADNTARIFENVGRAGPALAGIGSVAGLAAGMRAAGQYGTTLNLTAGRAGVSTTALQRFGNMAEISGGSAEGASASLEGLNKNLQLYAHGSAETDPRWRVAMRNLGIAATDAQGHARNAGAVMSDIMKKLAGMHNQQQRLYYGNALLGASFSSVLYPAIAHGAKGLQHYSDAAARMVILSRRQDQALTQSQVQMRRLGTDVQSVVYGALADFAPAVSKDISALSNWIERNQRASDSIAKITMAVGALSALRPAKWALSLLGLGGLVPSAATVVAGGSVLALHGDTGPGPQAGGRNGWGPAVGPNGEPAWWPKWLEPSPGGKARMAGSAALPKPGTAAYSVMEQTRQFWKSKGLTDAQAAGVLAGGPAAESSFDPNKWGDNHTSYGLYQEHGARMRALFAKYGPHPTVAQQNQFAWDEMRDPNVVPRGTWAALKHARGAGHSAFVWTRGFERPAGGVATAEMRARNASMFLPQRPSLDAQIDRAAAPYLPPRPAELLMSPQQAAATTVKGKAEVHVRIDGAPAGTRSSASTSGDLWQGAPKVTMPLPYGGGPAQ